MAKPRISASAGLAVAGRLAADGREVALDVAVEAVDDVVQRADLGHPLAVAAVDQVLRSAQHRLHHIRHAQRLPGGVGERDRGRLQRRGVEILLRSRVGRLDGLRQEPRQHARHERRQRQRQGRHRQVEAHVEQGRHMGRRGVQRRQPGRAKRQDRQEQHASDRPVGQVPEREPHAQGIAGRSFQDRIERAAQIGAQHHGQRRHGRDHARAGQRHDEQHHGHAGMRRPGDAGRQNKLGINDEYGHGRPGGHSWFIRYRKHLTRSTERRGGT